MRLLGLSVGVQGWPSSPNSARSSWPATAKCCSMGFLKLFSCYEKAKRIWVWHGVTQRLLHRNAFCKRLDWNATPASLSSCHTKTGKQPSASSSPVLCNTSFKLKIVCWPFALEINCISLIISFHRLGQKKQCHSNPSNAPLPLKTLCSKKYKKNSWKIMKREREREILQHDQQPLQLSTLEARTKDCRLW